MIRALRYLLAPFALLGALGPAWPQAAMLEPPGNHYFVSEGSWGQQYPDQWGLRHIGLDSSPQSAWRLVRASAQPVIVAVVDTGLDWNHRNIDWESIWRNPNASESSKPDEKNIYAGDVIGWNFLEHNNKPWDYDGHGTFVAVILAASWKDADGIAGINPFARLMVLKAVNDFGHARASYLAEAIAYAADHGARVINVSVGDKGSTAIEQAAVDYAYFKGAVIVVAAGNEGAEIKDYGIAGSEK